MSEHCHCGCHHEEPHHELNKYEQAFAKFDAPMSDEQVHAAVTKLFEERKAEYNTPETLRQLFAAVELTTLTVTDSQECVLRLVEKVNNFADAHPELPAFATICVYPNFAKIVADSLEV